MTVKEVVYEVCCVEDRASRLPRYRSLEVAVEDYSLSSHSLLNVLKHNFYASRLDQVLLCD